VIIERVSGMPWEQFVRKRIFEPLGMNETEPLVSMIVSKPNVAVPHALVNDSVAVVPIRSTDGVASAGSVWSSVSDMAKWVRFVIDSGRVGDTRLIQQKTFAELVTPQIQAPMDEYPALRLAKPDYFSYGLGWFIQDYRGQQVWMHTGSINGLCAIIGIEPNKRLGVYVLENLDHAEIRHGLMYSVFDLFENGPRRDWSNDLKPIFAPRPRGTTAADRDVRRQRRRSRSSATPGRTSTRPTAPCASPSRTAPCRPQSSPIPPCRSSRRASRRSARSRARARVRRC
jgi:CubicO group peptidase (beta-lactamase class C family)